MTPEFLLQLLATLAVAGGVYAAIRADLREALVKAGLAIKSADQAHSRLDQHIEIHHVRG